MVCVSAWGWGVGWGREGWGVNMLATLHRWSLGIDNWSHHKLCNWCDWLSMFGWKLNHVNKRGPGSILRSTYEMYIYIHIYEQPKFCALVLVRHISAFCEHIPGLDVAEIKRVVGDARGAWNKWINQVWEPYKYCPVLIYSLSLQSHHNDKAVAV